MRALKLFYVFDRPEARDIAEYIGEHGEAPAYLLKTKFQGDMTDSYFKSILQCLCHAEVVEMTSFARPAGQPASRIYKATKNWRKQLETAVDKRRQYNASPRGSGTGLYPRGCNYPTGEWVSNWKPFRDPLHTMLMGQK